MKIHNVWAKFNIYVYEYIYYYFFLNCKEIITIYFDNTSFLFLRKFSVLFLRQKNVLEK